MLIDWANYDQSKAKELASKFGNAALATMVQNIVSLDLIDRANLLNSLKMGVKSRQGFVEAVEFKYEYYGKFHEIGASNVFGEGVEIEAAHWRSNAVNQHLEMLNQDFAEYYAELTLEEVVIDSVKLKM